jgi:hypothetical protein
MTRLDEISYGGWKRCLRLSDGVLELVITLEVGPRVIRFGMVGGPNLFKEFPEQMGVTKGTEWLSFGGHRLWHAPEVFPRTYAPDFEPVDYEWSDGVLTLKPLPEPETRLGKAFQIALRDGQVWLNHRLYNHHPWAIEVAPWCLSVMAPGGTAVVPQEPFVPHGESFAPARPLVLWKFTQMNDSRYTWGDRLILLRQDDRVPTKQKIGMANKQGWAAYALGDQLFVKRFDWFEGETYTDGGCNCELFTMPGFLEVETLGPLKRLEPGAWTDHSETWSLIDGFAWSESEPELLKRLEPYIKERV